METPDQEGLRPDPPQRQGFAARYVSIRYTDRLADIGASASVGSVADSYDNAMAEALNGTFKAELIEMQGPLEGRRPSRAGDLPVEERLHSALDYIPPAVRASPLAEPGANPAVGLKQDHRTLRNSGQLKVPPAVAGTRTSTILIPAAPAPQTARSSTPRRIAKRQVFTAAHNDAVRAARGWRTWRSVAPEPPHPARRARRLTTLPPRPR